METYNSLQIGVLNDLLKINYDRIEGYQKATSDSHDHPYLIPTFREMENQSERNAMELKAKITSLGGEPANHETVAGKIYHAWMEMRTAFSKSQKTLLELCEFGEDAALKAYDAALKAENKLDSVIHGVIVQQQSELKKSHDTIRAMRDKANTASETQ